MILSLSYFEMKSLLNYLIPRLYNRGPSWKCPGQRLLWVWGPQFVYYLMLQISRATYHEIKVLLKNCSTRQIQLGVSLHMVI